MVAEGHVSTDAAAGCERAPSMLHARVPRNEQRLTPNERPPSTASSERGAVAKRGATEKCSPSFTAPTSGVGLVRHTLRGLARAAGCGEVLFDGLERWPPARR